MKKHKRVTNLQDHETLTIQNTDLTGSFADISSWGFGSLNPNSTAITSFGPLFNNLNMALISNFRNILNYAYSSIGLVRKVCSIPPEDALRQGFEIKSEILDEDEIKLLQRYIAKEDLISKLVDAFTWVRLFGGGALLILTGQDSSKPLDRENLNSLEFAAVDPWELFYDSYSATDEQLGKLPLVDDTDPDFCYNYYGRMIHNSRVIKFKGKTAPSFVRPRLRGWGLSEIETLIQSLNKFTKMNNVLYEFIDESKIDCFKIKGLSQSMLTKDGSARVQRRVQYANNQKNYLNALTIDADDDFSHKQINFSGLADIALDNRAAVASDINMPMSKLFSSTPTGYTSTDAENDNYITMCESSIRTKAKLGILEVLHLVCSHLFGYDVPDIDICFPPMHVLSAKDQSAVNTQTLGNIMQAVTLGLMTPYEAKLAMNKAKVLPIAVDPDEDSYELMANVLEAQTPEVTTSDTTTSSSSSAKKKPKQKKPSKGGKGEMQEDDQKKEKELNMEWVEKLSPVAKQNYINRHPNSLLAKRST